MRKSKLEGLLGFASRSKNLITGSNACLDKIPKRAVSLVIISEDVGENTRKKLMSKCKTYGIDYRIFGKAEDLSHITGKIDKGIFGITDKGFADSICKEIDLIQSEREVSHGEKGI